MSSLERLPVIPLRNSVVYPDAPLAIRAGRPGTLAAIQAALERTDGRVFVTMQTEDVTAVAIEGLYAVGAIARIAQVEPVTGGLSLVLEGERRARVEHWHEEDDRLEAEVRGLLDIQPPDVESPAFVGLVRELRQRAIAGAQKVGFPEGVAREQFGEVPSHGALADRVAAALELDRAERQALLEELSVEVRLRRALMALERRITAIDAQQDIRDKVQAELGERQREMVLREQLKAIQRELAELGGEGPQDDDLRARLEVIDLPAEVRKEVSRELDRLEAGQGAEVQVIRRFLETIAELPWTRRSEDHLDLARAEATLEEDHYGLPEVKERVLEYLAVRRLHALRGTDDDVALAEGERDERRRSPILLFAGPPGVGKTSIAKSIARALGREYQRISLGGVRDEADVRGHRRTYVGAMPGRIVEALRRAGTRNPVILLDEVEKLGVSMQGDPSAALLEVLDPAQNHQFVDHYLGVPIDLSEVLFVATANVVERIPGPLFDRMEPIEFRGYTAEEKREIARRYLLPRQLRANALDEANLTLGREAMTTVIDEYTREAGVRQLDRQLGKIARKAARRVAAGEAEHVLVDAPDVPALLGRRRARPERTHERSEVGVATGMFYTPMGGDIMFVEVSSMPGKGNLKLTGQLGDVMRESAQTAWSWARAHADELGIPHERFERRDLHLHVPAGAIPKDGPSAGIALTAALVSALTGVRVRADVAMTGEVTLSGRVLPVGGIKEKVLGALRAGARQVLLPSDNAGDLDELPAAARAALDIVLVDSLPQALELVLDERSRKSQRRRLEVAGDPFLGLRPSPGLRDN